MVRTAEEDCYRVLVSFPASLQRPEAGGEETLKLD